MKAVGDSRLQRRLAVFPDDPTVEDLIARREDQWFDRTSFRSDARQVADKMIGFANADGGRLAVGLSNGEVDGDSSMTSHLNDVRQAALNFTDPPIRHSIRELEATGSVGRGDCIVLIDIEASETLHRNRKGECFLRVGDENRRLSGAEERELTFDKGESTFDKRPLADFRPEDLDQDLIAEYADQVGVSDSHRLLRSRGLITGDGDRPQVTYAGAILFSRDAPIWSYVRYLRFEGTEALPGERSNVTQDIRFSGPLPTMIPQCKEQLEQQLRVNRLGQDGKFGWMSVLPHFVWLEAMVNAVTHRSYSLQGDGVRIRHFADRLEVESPGRLPGLVRVENIRRTRYARNPHIARVLAEYTSYVREMNEGVNRMFTEMETQGLRPPEFIATEASVKVILWFDPKFISLLELADIPEKLNWFFSRVGLERASAMIDFLIRNRRISSADVQRILNVTMPTARTYLVRLQNSGLLRMIQSKPHDPRTVWELVPSDPLSNE